MSTIPPEVKETVTFVFIKDSSGELVEDGTAFFVLVGEEGKKRHSFEYLVTAKHVLCDPQGRYYPDIFIRLNRVSGGSEFVRIPLTGQKPVPVYLHHDTTVDIAVLPMQLTKDINQYRRVPEEMITTRERFAEAEIKEGDEVFFIGLFPPFYGGDRNYPIVRFGRVAMLTEERIPLGREMLNLYLIECQSFGGNSGSPVFFYLSPRLGSFAISMTPRTLLLAGIIKGSFFEPREVGVARRTPTFFSSENLGIAAVVPAYQLHEILFSDELQRARASGGQNSRFSASTKFN